MLQQRPYISQSLFRVIVHPQMGADKGANQPAPNCALVIRPIPLVPVTAVMADVGGIIRGQAAQAVRREQVAAARIHHGTLLDGRQRTVGQGDGQ